MATKSATSVKSKSSVKTKSYINPAKPKTPQAATRPKKNNRSSKSDFPVLSEASMSNFGVGIYIVQNGKFVYVSPLFQKLCGYSSADLIGANPLDYISPDYREKTRKQAIKRLKGESSGAYEYQIIRKNGKAIWIMETITPILYTRKRAALGTFMDITKRKQTDAALKQSDERYKALFDHSLDTVFVHDLRGNFLDMNQAGLDRLDYNRDELLSLNLDSLLDEEQITKNIGITHELMQKGFHETPAEYRVKRKDGTYFDVENKSSLVYRNGKPYAVIGISRNITEHRRMKNELHKSEERYRNILENIEDGYADADLNGNFTFFNDSVCRIWGYPKEELMGMNYRQYTDTETAAKLREAFHHVYTTGQGGKSCEYQIRTQNGDKKFIETSIALRKDDSGKIIGFRGITRDITERYRSEEALRQSEEKYRTILENISDGYYETDVNGNMTFFNNALCHVTGHDCDSLMGMNYQEYTDKENAKKLFKTYAQVYLAGKAIRGCEYEVTQKDGTKKYLESSIALRKDSSGNILGFRGITRDTTDRKHMEEQIRQSEERYRTIIDEMEECYFEADLTGNVTFFNENFANVVGYAQKDITGINFQDLIKKDDINSIYRLFNEIFRTGKATRNFLHQFFRADGSVTSAEFSVFPKRDQEGRICGFRGVGHDITERKRAEERIQYLATHDALTGLPNRLMFSQLLHHAIQTAKRYERQFAVLFIDLDRFKTINDSMGHEAGDQLLQEIATRLTETLRAVDVVARLGGDEFVVLIEEFQDLDQLKTVAGRILSSVIKPVFIGKQECRVTASIGISIFPNDADDEQSLMKNSDIAMYFAKEEGKNNFQFYSMDIQSKSLEHLSIETNLRYALEREEFSLHYQAKVDFKTNKITGVEALIRWQNATLGSVTPTQFIPVAEETGLIIPIGKWVIQTACLQNVAWQSLGLPSVCIAVNLSLRQLTDDYLIDDISAALNHSGMAPNLLELEITESMVMHNPSKVIAVLNKIKSLGVRLAIDDFGTGYSSLAQIKHFPVDILKVDRSFIRNIPADIEDKAITEAIINMGKSLCLTVVAEGVETVEQIDFLKDHFCDEMQGYYFSKPISSDQFADLLKEHIPSPEK